MQQATRLNSRQSPMYSPKKNRGDAGNKVFDFALFADIDVPVQRRVLQAGDTLFRTGDNARFAYGLQQGLIKVLTRQPNGKERIIRLHAPGRLFGLNGLFEPDHRHSALSLGRAEVLQIPLFCLRQLETQNPRMFSELLKEIYWQVVEADTWISEFSTGTAKSRLARLLIFLARLEFGYWADKVELLTVQEMADIVGITPESVSRITAEFKREQILCKLNDGTKDGYWINAEKIGGVLDDD